MLWNLEATSDWSSTVEPPGRAGPVENLEFRPVTVILNLRSY